LQNADEAEKRVGGCDEMVGEVPRWLTVKTAVHHDTQLVTDPLWHVHPVELILEVCRQGRLKMQDLDNAGPGK